MTLNPMVSSEATKMSPSPQHGADAPMLGSSMLASNTLTPNTLSPNTLSPNTLSPLIEALAKVLDDGKAADILTIDLMGKTSLADAMLIASGTSDRHVNALAERIASALKDMGQPAPRIEGMPVCDWVLIDAGDVLIHLFRPEVRGFYNLEKLWGMGRPQEGVMEDAPVQAKPKRIRA